jgi:1,4-dihydroxy-2-naphthoyl-CoA synthase
MLSIEKLIALVIFLIILLVLIAFIILPEVMGKDIGSQHDLRLCCQAYIARGCPEFSNPESDLGSIDCGNHVSMGELVVQYGMNHEALKAFCNCPR